MATADVAFRPHSPPAKRRRLNPAHSAPEDLGGYISIAKVEAAISLDLSVSKRLEALVATENSLTVLIESVRRIGENVKLSIQTTSSEPMWSELRSTEITCHKLASSAESQYVEKLSEDCTKLKTVKKDADHRPLACYHASIHRSEDTWVFQARILWEDTPQARDKVDPRILDLLFRYQHVDTVNYSPDAQTWHPRNFYESVHVPKKEKNVPDLRIDLLQCRLFPFQMRAVRWLLEREGVQANLFGQIGPIGPGDTIREDQSLPLGFFAIKDADNKEGFANQALGVVSTDLNSIRSLYCGFKGGILAEEMGLGKTVEMIALMCLHKRSLEGEKVGSLRKSRATLIITPPTILQQWKQELAEHAPALTVRHYEGVKVRTRRELDSEIVDELADNDVVLTTYNVISKELHYVAEKPSRSLRHKPRYEHPKSPLTQISWWRVCLDEAQLVESGVSAAATVARLIPRENAWAVSGTPLKRDHKDLFGLLLFLRFEPWCQSFNIWARLVHHYRPLFATVLNQLTLRHSKEHVREDLRLPPQGRISITVPFTAIEEQYYSQLFEQMCDECGVDLIGSPLKGDWDPESAVVVEKMRMWLARLRQICLHPELGGRNRRALGRLGGPLRSVTQVLDVMIDQNDVTIRSEQRSLLMSQIKRGQMLENAKYSKEAMALWRAAYDASCDIVHECRAQVDAELQLHDMPGEKRPDETEESELEARLTTHKARLRSALEVQHICIFFIANAYFQLKSDTTTVDPSSEEFTRLQKLEEAAYEEAKAIRGELLSEVLKKANQSMDVVRKKATEGSFAIIPRIRLDDDYSGIESRKIFEKFHRYGQAMNLQADQLAALREKIITFLRHSLIDDDGEIELQGDEYEGSTKREDEMYALMEVLRALFADRSDAISGQENMLIRHEMRLLLQTAKTGQGPAPDVVIKLLAEREEKRLPAELGSLRGIITEMRHLLGSLEWQAGNDSSRARAELAIANHFLQHGQTVIKDQLKSITALEQEVNQFRDTMNNRLEYHRALQKISDTVAPFEEEKVGQPVDMARFSEFLQDEERRKDKLSTYLAKRRYLLHLKAESSSTSSTRICTICQCEFEIGTLTVCGHQFCKECISLWYKEKKNCPVCKKTLKDRDFWQITYKPAELAVQEDGGQTASSSPGSSEKSISRSIYSDVSSSTIAEIKNIDLHGNSSYGSKLDTICRHVLYLREHDAGSKTIVFSQYAEFLDVLRRAFKQQGIACTRIDDKNGIERFKSDVSIECFLLHAKAHSTGLNLVVASHVILCEPLINTALELQAIARVHRIGQQRATTVWMYLVAGTVEESIYEISVARRMAHMQRRTKSGPNSGATTPGAITENFIDAANSLELQAADLSQLLTSGRSGGERVSSDDLWQCLFGKKRRDAAFSGREAQADGEVGRFLRAEAAAKRKTDG